jgi:hypothetical protein
MVNKYRVICSLLLLSTSFCSAQIDTSRNSFSMPLSVIQGITGSFGEIRVDHFHSGVDLRTDNKIGKEVRATFDGYISRIKVSPVGFGKAIFVDHPNGLTTVYGHLDRYSDKINRYIKNIQYRSKSFDVEVFPKPTEIPIKKGDLLGYSGNSGGSFGPHLHYEVRTSVDQRPLNPIPKYIKLVDSIPPFIKSLHFYRLDSTSYANGYSRKSDVSVIKNHNVYTINTKIEACGKIGIGIDVLDKINSQSTQCGFKSITLTVNNKVVYRLTLDQFSFAETRYVNSIIDYPTRYTTNKEIVKLFAEPCNFFSGLHDLFKKGILTIEPDSLYKIVILVADASSNTSKLSFNLKGISAPINTQSKKSISPKTVLLSCMIENSIVNDTFTLQIPKYSLYNNLYFEHSCLSLLEYKYSSLVKLHNPLTPLHQKVIFDLKATNIPTKYQSKALLATIGSDKKISAAGGDWKNGYVRGYITAFGDYFITLDTIAPEIKPINIKQGSTMTGIDGIRLTVTDEFSGIKKVDGYIDGNWVLFDYDKKNNLIYYQFDRELLVANKSHTLEIVATDTKDNISRFNCDFLW